jgi:serine/threonine protein kinase
MSIGSQLGAFRIVEFLGAGGMGEVYRATDTRLHRDVAIKTLPAEYAQQPEWLSRCQSEARALASLNHSHICALHDVGPNYLVMEYVEGETLAARIKKGALPLHEALRIAIEVASALIEAHRKGIVHRDLKPGNVMLTARGAVLLDFGLAKSRQSAMAGEDAITAAVTSEAMVAGTAPYICRQSRYRGRRSTRAATFSRSAWCSTK